jgi:hypothetical protein
LVWDKEDNFDFFGCIAGGILSVKIGLGAAGDVFEIREG